MLTENDVVEYFCDYLIQNGYEIKQSLSTKEQGIDIIAEKNNRILKVEAKGATSSKATSSKYGEEFSGAQVRTHVAVGLYAISKLITKDNSSFVDYALVLPDNLNHVNKVNNIESVLKRLSIDVYFVNEDGEVREL